jgi:ketosteroid isomerase-like protein
MPHATTPEALHLTWTDRFNAGDLDGLMELYETGIVMMPEPGKLASGHAAVREALAGFLALKGRFALQVQRSIEADGIALVFSKWTLSAQTPQGPLELTGQTSDVMRRQQDGRWLCLIDNPFGAQAIDAAQRT